jgi:hypothetical protein
MSLTEIMYSLRVYGFAILHKHKKQTRNSEQVTRNSFKSNFIPKFIRVLTFHCPK